MTDLKRWRWKTYVPNLGNNLEQERPFSLRLKSGLSKVAYADWLERWGAAVTAKDVAAMAAVLAEVAEMGQEPLSVDGRPVDTLEGYLALCLDEPDEPLIIELTGAFQVMNCVLGQQADFSARLSGGSFTTPSTSPGTAAPRAGSKTSA